MESGSLLFTERARAAGTYLLALSLAGALALSSVACSDGTTATGPDDGPGGDEGSVTFYVGNPGQASASIGPSARASVSGARPPVDPDQIHSLEIMVESIQAHMTTSATGTPPWITIDLDPPVMIDPATLELGQVAVMTSAEMPEGDYDIVRLIPESVTVQFQTSSSTTPIVVGQREYAPAPAEHPATVPSGRITIPTAHFTVDDGGGAVMIVWDAEETAATVNATGSGMILVLPVFNEATPGQEADLEP